MLKVVTSIVLGGLLVALAAFAVNAHNEEVAKLETELGRQKLRAEYDERAGAINAASNPDMHKEQLVSLIKWYDSSLSDLYNLHPGIHDPDAPMKALQAEVSAGSLKAEELANKKEWYDETKNLYDSIEHGKYDPMVTTVLDGIRVDIIGLKRATVDGRSRLRMDVVLWGAPRREVATKIEQGQETRTKEQLDFGFTGLDLEFIDAKEKLLGGGNTGAPTMVVDYPEHWIPDFPPQVALAIWYLDPFPADTKTVNLKMNGEVRSPTGPSQSVSQDWKLVAQQDWLVRPGETFAGEERVMSKDEIDRSAKANAGK